MKTKVLFLIAVIICVFLVSFCIVAGNLPFKDVKEGDWFYNDVKYAYENNFINGKNSPDTFLPNENMTYAEAIKLAACMHQKYTTGEVTLKNGNPWYQTYLDYCKDNKITDKEYSYNALVTRAGYMEIFAKALPDEALKAVNNVPDNSIPDVPSSLEGAESIYKLYRAGILAGADELHNCVPGANIKRCEVAVIMSRMMDSTKRISFDTLATAPIEEVKVETFEMPEKKQWENYTFGNEGDKTVAEQRQEIKDAMDRAINTETVWKEIPEYNPTIEEYSHIKAITYDGFEYKGKKTKVFAFVGFPEGASADSPVPAVVLVHGGGGHPYMEWVKKWNDRGYAAIAMETTGYFPPAVNVGVSEKDNSLFVYGLTDFFAEEGYGDAPKRTYATTYTEVSEQWAYHGLTQVILASNILRADERVDKDKIGVTGISWGGVTVAQLIGYDNRYAFAIPIYGTAYMGDEMRPFSNLNDPYVDALWAAERNLDNATMPIFWFVYNDDNNFGVPSYVKSYMHTQGQNEKNTLVMLDNWGHSHGSGYNKDHSFWFADWATSGKNGFVTFLTQPKGREVNCRINIPEGTGYITPYVYYITEPMSYSKFNKNGRGEYVFLDQSWQKTRSWLKVDKETGTVSGTIPDDVKGYYIDLQFKTEKSRNNSSSVFVSLD